MELCNWIGKPTGDIYFKDSEPFWINLVFQILKNAFSYSFSVVTGCCYDGE